MPAGRFRSDGPGRRALRSKHGLTSPDLWQNMPKGSQVSVSHALQVARLLHRYRPQRETTVLGISSAAQADLPPKKPYPGKTHNCLHIAAHLLQRCGEDATNGPWNEAASAEHQSHASQRQDVGTQGQGQQDEDPATDRDRVRHKVCTAPVWLSVRLCLE